MNNLLTMLRFALAAVAFAALPVHAQSFTPETRISTFAGPSIQPNIAAAGNNLFVVWVENFDNGSGYKGDIYFRRSLDNGTTWQPAINLGTTPAVNDQLPQIATNSTGTNVYITWTDDPVQGELYYSRSIDSGANFSAPVTLSNSAGGFYSRPGAVFVDSGGRVHVAWYDNKTVGYGQIYYRCSADGGASFSAEARLTQFDGVTDFEAPRITQGTDGTMYMLVRSTRAGMPYNGYPPFDQFLFRTNAPVAGCSPTWLHPPQKISKGLPDEFANTYGGLIVPGAGNVLHAAYWSDKLGTNLIYRRGLPNGKGWGTPTDVSSHGAGHPEWDGTAAEMSDFGLGEDAAGKVHVVFGENNHLRDGVQSGSLYYRCSNDGGLTWIARTLASGQTETAQPRAVYNNNRFHIVWMDWRDNNTGAEIYYRNVATGSCSASAVQLSQSTSAIAFGGMSMGTTSPPQAVTITNTGGTTLTVSGINFDNGQFSQTTDCASVAPGGSCTINVFFTPAAAAGGLNSTVGVGGTMSIVSNATSSPNTVTLTGTAEKSLITHFYWSILRRAPDSGGNTFWQGEDVRMQGLGANINETWYAMAQFFFFSPEYVALGRDNTGFVTDLYNTFFNRAPDASGLAYWVGQLNSGMPREVVLVSFMISPEFNSFAQGIFGSTAAFAEVDMVGDFYRGILARLPDTSGFNSWVAAFRNSQCQGANAGTSVYATVQSISNAFINGSEYAGRARTNAQYVGDLYNAFLRRGGDLPGVNYWINQLNTSAETRDQLRQDFISSSEFTGRVNNVINTGCH